MTTLAATRPTSPTGRGRSSPVLAGLLVVLAVALSVNTVLGPLGTGAINYPISETLLNQTIGLEAITAGLVVPITLVAAVLSLRGHRASAFLGLGPAAYSAYMLLQYVLGPEYPTYTPVALFHVAVFTLSVLVAVVAWSIASRQPLPLLSTRRRRLYGAMLLLMTVFILSRYSGVVASGRLPPEFAEATTFYWSIFLLDLGIVAPVTATVGIGLLRDSPVARSAMYAVILWYALVPPSVAAMSLTMVINGDTHASTGQAILLGVVAVGFGCLAAWVYRPLLRTPGRSTET